MTSATGRQTPASTGISGQVEDKPTGSIKVKSQALKKSDSPSSRSGSPSINLPDGTVSRNSTSSDTVTCKHCKQTIDKSSASSHAKQCLKEKQERLKQKKEAKDAKDAAAKDKDNDKDAEGEGEKDEPSSSKAAEKDNSISDTPKNAKKTAVKEALDDNKKGKKRKAEGDGDKAPKKQKKKDDPKVKAPKVKGPVDVEKQCGVPLPNGALCARSLTCKSHAMGAKRAVPGRSMRYDILLQQYQKKNQAKQQKAAIDANAPLQDDLDAAASGPVDSDEEKDAIMAGIARARPQPLMIKPAISTRSKYQYIRMKEMLHNALGGSRGAGLFSTSSDGGRNTTFGDGSNRESALPLDAASDTFSRRPAANQRAVGSNIQGIRKQSTPGIAT